MTLQERVNDYLYAAGLYGLRLSAASGIAAPFINRRGTQSPELDGEQWQKLAAGTFWPQT